MAISKFLDPANLNCTNFPTLGNEDDHHQSTMIIIISSKNGTSKLKASHFFLPHGLKLRPGLSRAIFAINSTFMIQFCLFPMKYHCEVQIAFSRKLKFHASPENNTQQINNFCSFNFSTGQRSFLAMKWESTWEWGWGQSGQPLKRFYSRGLPPVKKRSVTRRAWF